MSKPSEYKHVQSFMKTLEYKPDEDLWDRLFYLSELMPFFRTETDELINSISYLTHCNVKMKDINICICPKFQILALILKKVGTVICSFRIINYIVKHGKKTGEDKGRVCTFELYDSTGAQFNLVAECTDLGSEVFCVIHPNIDK